MAKKAKAEELDIVSVLVVSAGVHAPYSLKHGGSHRKGDSQRYSCQSRHAQKFLTVHGQQKASQSTSAAAASKSLTLDRL
jgi:hypothetical protein